MRVEEREKAYKAVAFTGVGMSLLAILAVCLTMPLVYNFVSQVQYQTVKELQFCKVCLRKTSKQQAWRTQACLLDLETIPAWCGVGTYIP